MKLFRKGYSDQEIQITEQLTTEEIADEEEKKRGPIILWFKKHKKISSVVLGTALFATLFANCHNAKDPVVKPSESDDLDKRPGYEDMQEEKPEIRPEKTIQTPQLVIAEEKEESVIKEVVETVKPKLTIGTSVESNKKVTKSNGIKKDSNITIKKPTTIVETVKPVVPEETVKPVEPVKPEEITKPVEPVKPEEITKPEEKDPAAEQKVKDMIKEFIEKLTPKEPTKPEEEQKPEENKPEPDKKPTPSHSGGSSRPSRPSVDPTPVDPTPEDPTPEDPTPVDPTPEDPTPVDPTPVDPTPEDPTPVDPTPEDPTPEDPTPEEPGRDHDKDHADQEGPGNGEMITFPDESPSDENTSDNTPSESVDTPSTPENTPSVSESTSNSEVSSKDSQDQEGVNSHEPVETFSESDTSSSSLESIQSEIASLYTMREMAIGATMITYPDLNSVVEEGPVYIKK